MQVLVTSTRSSSSRSSSSSCSCSSSSGVVVVSSSSFRINTEAPKDIPPEERSVETGLSRPAEQRRICVSFNFRFVCSGTGRTGEGPSSPQPHCGCSWQPPWSSVQSLVWQQYQRLQNKSELLWQRISESTVLYTQQTRTTY